MSHASGIRPLVLDRKPTTRLSVLYRAGAMVSKANAINARLPAEAFLPAKKASVMWNQETGAPVAGLVTKTVPRVPVARRTSSAQAFLRYVSPSLQPKISTAPMEIAQKSSGDVHHAATTTLLSWFVIQQTRIGDWLASVLEAMGAANQDTTTQMLLSASARPVSEHGSRTGSAPSTSGLVSDLAV